MQLASKMRFAGVQLEALLAGDLWHRNASQANRMAARLGKALERIEGVELAQPVEANGVFARFPRAAIERLELGPEGDRAFYVWEEASGTVRLMCSWDTAPEDVDAFAASVEETVAGVAGSSR